MSTLTITKTYNDTDLLSSSDLNPFIDNIKEFINTTKITDDNIQNAGITGSEKLEDGSITTAKFTNSVVTEEKLNDGSVTTVLIADSNVTTAKIADSNVTTAKISDSAVTTAKIADGAVTYAKRVLNNIGGSVSTTSVINSSGTFTLGSVALTTTGNSVFLLLNCKMRVSSGVNALATVTIRAKRGSTTIAEWYYQCGATTGSVSTTTRHGRRHLFVDITPAAGAYTYTFEAIYSTLSNGEFHIESETSNTIYAYEL